MQIPSIGVVGLGGFGQNHHGALWELERAGELRVIATCDPAYQHLAAIAEEMQFGRRGVEIFPDPLSMLAKWAGRMEWVSVASPVFTHAAVHEACVKRGLSCYLEKPPTLDPGELERMIQVDGTATHFAQVGFNFIYEPERLALKRRLLAGEFGAVRQLTLLGAWPRNEAYYARNSWAGRLRFRDHLVLDSCLGNAMAHHVHNILFFAGTEGFFSWGACQEVESELFRGRPIEGADTALVRARLPCGIEARFALTHACEGDSVTEENIICDDARISILPGSHIEIDRFAHPREIIPLPARHHLKDNLRYYNQYCLGQQPRPLTKLQDCRAFVALNALAYLSSDQIRKLPVDWINQGIHGALHAFLESGEFPANLSDSSRRQARSPQALGRLREVIAEIATIPAPKAPKIARKLEIAGTTGGLAS